MQSAKSHSALYRTLKYCAIALVSVVALIVLTLGVATWLLTPDRLAEIINREASRNVNADVKVGDVKFTLWSTFPHLCIEADSISVRSRNFDSLPAAQKALLPDSADFLVSASKVRGGINLIKIFGGKYLLQNIEIDSLRLNLVALTDSLNNYNIVAAGRKSKIPYFHVDTLRIRDHGRISYTGVPSHTDARILLSGASLIPIADMKDSYKLRFLGKVSAASGGLNVLHNFPVELDGDVSLKFKPFGVSTDNYAVRLGDVKGSMSMDVNFGDNVSLNNFNYHLDSFTLQNLIDLLPQGQYPFLQHLRANIDVSATARLTSPYDFSSTRLPSIEVQFFVADGDISYSLTDSEEYTAHHVGLRGIFNFDGNDPSASRIHIPRFGISGEGVSLLVEADVTDLTGDPSVKARLQAAADLPAVGKAITALAPLRLGGKLDLDAALKFRLADSTLYGTSLDLTAKADRLSLADGRMKVALTDFFAHTAESYPEALTIEGLLNDIPLKVTAGARSAHLDLPQDSVTLHLAALKFTGNIGRLGHGDVMRTFALRFDGDNVSLESKGNKVLMNGVKANLAASRLSKPIHNTDFRLPNSWIADSITMSAVSHTPQYITANLPKSLTEIMRNWKTFASLKIGNAELITDRFPVKNTLRNLDIAASFDSVSVRSVTLQSGQTLARVKGGVSRLRQFLSSHTPAPLRINLNLEMDTVQINQLARVYAAVNPQAINKQHIEASSGIADTVAMLIPRNIIADIHATAMQTRYINLHLYDLATDMHIENGCADIDSLHIGADFGEASLNMKYDTSDLQNLGMNLNLGIKDVDVVRFFQNFHKLLLMMPQMKNLSGTLSAEARGRLMMFPNNYLNVPSIVARVGVQGRELTLRQDPFIRHVTRMLLIPDSKELHIADINVNANVHDNLLEVYPFDFEVSKYKLQLSGLNNFNGDIYYHIGVENWPLRLPFGINIKGSYHHPQLRFGGAHWKDEHGAKIAAGVMDSNRINILKEMRKYMGEFVRTAATYQGD